MNGYRHRSLSAYTTFFGLKRYTSATALGMHVDGTANVPAKCCRVLDKKKTAPLGGIRKQRACSLCLLPVAFHCDLTSIPELLGRASHVDRHNNNHCDGRMSAADHHRLAYRVTREGVAENYLGYRGASSLLPLVLGLFV